MEEEKEEERKEEDVKVKEEEEEKEDGRRDGGVEDISGLVPTSALVEPQYGSRDGGLGSNFPLAAICILILFHYY